MVKIIKRFLKWLKSLFKKVPKTTIIEVPWKPALEPPKVNPTKAYADQRQKMPKNRKRHPSKRMKNIYKTL